MTKDQSYYDAQLRAANNAVVHREGEERQARYHAKLAAAAAEKRERRKRAKADRGVG